MTDAELQNMLTVYLKKYTVKLRLLSSVTFHRDVVMVYRSIGLDQPMLSIDDGINSLIN